MFETLSLILSHPILLAKIIGAVLGSSIAVIFQPDHDTPTRLLARFVIGVVIGVVFSPVVLDWFKLAHVWDYWLAASTGCGATGVLIMQIIFSKRVYDALETRAQDKLDKR